MKLLYFFAILFLFLISINKATKHYHRHIGSKERISSTSKKAICLPICGPKAIEGSLTKIAKKEYSLAPEDGTCAFHYNSTDYSKCLNGKWILMMGASNMDILARRFAAFMMSKGSDVAFPEFNPEMSSFDFILYKNGSHSIHQKSSTGLRYYTRVPEEMAPGFVEVDQFWDDVEQRTEPFISRLTLISDRWLLVATYFLKRLTNNKKRYGKLGMNLVIGYIDIWYHYCVSRKVWLTSSLCKRPKSEIMAVYKSEINIFFDQVRQVIESGAIASMLVLTLGKSYDDAQEMLRKFSPKATTLATSDLYWVGDMFQAHPSGSKSLYIFTAFMSTICGFEKTNGCAQRPLYSPECTANWIEQKSKSTKDMYSFSSPCYRTVTYHGCKWYSTDFVVRNNKLADYSIAKTIIAPVTIQQKHKVKLKSKSLPNEHKLMRSNSLVDSPPIEANCFPICGPKAIEGSLTKIAKKEYSLAPEDGTCAFHYNSTDYSKCLNGKWILVIGESNVDILARRFAAFMMSKGSDVAFPEFNPDMSHLDFILYKNGSHSIYQKTVLGLHNYSRVSEEMAPGFAEVDQFWDVVEQRTEPFISRLTLISDRWLLVATYFLKRLTNNKKRYGKLGMNLVIGYTDIWYHLCSLGNIWMKCSLCERPSSEVLAVYKFELSTFIIEVSQVINSGAVASAFMLTIDRNYAATKELVMKLSSKAISLATPDLYWVGDMFQENPSGTKALYIFTAFMSTICGFESSHGCAQRPLFSPECTANWLEKKSKSSKDFNLFSPFYKTVLYHGCKWYSSDLAMRKTQPNNDIFTELIEYPVVSTSHKKPVVQGPAVGSSFQAGGLETIPPALYIHANTLALLSFFVLAIAVYAKFISLNKTKQIVKSEGECEFGPPVDPVKSHPTPNTDLIDSMYFCRYLASLHVVAGHLQAKGYTLIPGAEYFLSWGFTWVPFFFVLSGFVLALAKLKKGGIIASNVEPVHVYVWKRLCNIYPLYYVALILAAILNYVSHSYSKAAGSAPIMLLEIFLLQSWVPNIIEESVQAHCWFLSCEVFYWFLFSTMISIVNKMSHALRLFCFIMCAFIIPHLFLSIPQIVFGLGDHWYSSHKTGRMSEAVDILVVTLKFYPLSYVHDFFLGVLLAYLTKTFLRYSSSKTEGFGELIGKKLLCLVVENGMTIGYVLLGAVFFIPSLRPYDHKLSCRLGLLSPLHSLILVSMAVRKDPLEKMFSHWIPKMLGEWSYCQFVLQFIIFKVYVILTGTDVDETAFQFWLFMTSCSYTAYIFLQNPLKSPFNFSIFMQFWLPSVIFFSFVLGTSDVNIPSALNSVTTYCKHFIHPAVPRHSVAFIDRKFGSYDAKLNLSFDKSEYDLINPSIIQSNTILLNSSYLIAARKHYLETSMFTTKDGRPEVRFIYHSGLTVGLLSADLKQIGPMLELDFNYFPVSFGTNNTKWIPCQHVKQEISKNNSVFSVMSTGPEDPRIVSDGNSTTIYFFSYQPVKSPQTCQLEGNIGTIYMSTITLSTNTAGALSVRAAQPVPVDLHSNKSKITLQRIEKNWLPFVFRGFKNYVYSVSPHLVIDEKGNRHNGNSDILKSRLGLDKYSFVNMSVHGGASPILTTDVLVGPPWGNDPVFIASCHTSNPAAKKEYIHYLYAFKAKPPFDIVAVSSSFELVDQPNKHSETFVSSLSKTLDSKYLLGYGSGDVESRVLVMSLEFIREKFNHAV